MKIWFQNNRYKTKKVCKEKGITHLSQPHFISNNIHNINTLSTDLPTVHVPPSANPAFLSSEFFGGINTGNYNTSFMKFSA